MTRGLLDTSTVILLGRVSEPSALPDECLVSAVTLAELSVGPLHLQQAESDFDVVPFDAAAARAYHALIAATAVALGVPVYTCSPSDFAGIPCLEVRAVSVDAEP